MAELFGLIVGYAFYGTLLLMLFFPLILAFLECWKRASLMLAMIAASGFLAIGVSVFLNYFLAIVFFGGMIGLIIGAVWDRHDKSIFA